MNIIAKKLILRVKKELETYLTDNTPVCPACLSLAPRRYAAGIRTE